MIAVICMIACCVEAKRKKEVELGFVDYRLIILTWLVIYVLSLDSSIISNIKLFVCVLYHVQLWGTLITSKRTELNCGGSGQGRYVMDACAVGGI